MTTSEINEEFDELLNQLCDGQLPDSDWQPLVELLAQSEAHRQRYLNYTELHAFLWLGGAVRPAACLPLAEEVRLEATGLEKGLRNKATGLRESAATSQISSLTPHASGLLPQASPSTQYSVLSTRYAVLCVGVLATIAASIAGLLHGLQSQGKQPLSNPPQLAAASFQSIQTRPAVFVARVAAANCIWVDPESTLGEGAKLAAGRRLELASGQVKIVFQSGAEVTLHGPAIFEIQSANSAFLTLGRLSARAATPESRGFTVHSRTAATVDLGTQFNIVATEDGHSQIQVVEGAVEVQLSNGKANRRLGVGQSIEVEPGKPSVIARIEPGDCTPAFKFPTIEPPSAHDYADASNGHAHIRVLRGQAHFDSGPVEVLLDGYGQSKPDSPKESFFFNVNASGMILLDLGQTVPVKKVNTYSWHHRSDLPRDRTRATQKYFLYGSRGATPPGADGNLAAAGWTLIARVNTDEFFAEKSGTWPRSEARPEQQAVSITTTAGDPIGEYRYLLWDVRPTRADENVAAFDNTFYGEFDVYRQGQ